jgi:HK97 family phage major capsid protein
MKRTSVQIKEAIAALKEEAKAMTAKARTDVRMLSETESQRMDSIKREIATLNEEQRQLEADLEKAKSINIQNNNNSKQEKEMKKKPFSLVQAIRYASDPSHVEASEELRAVLEAGRAEFAKNGIATAGGGFQLPSVTEERTVTVGTEGSDVVATDLLDVVGEIRNRSILTQLGADFLPGLVGDVQMPVGTNVTASWESEIAAVNEQTPTFSSKVLSPKRLAAMVILSNQLLRQDSAGVEAFIRRSIVDAIMAKLETTLLGNAAGSTTQPAGLFYLASGSHPVVDSFADLCALEALLDGKAWGAKKYALSPAAKSAFRSMIKGTNATGMVYANGEMDGTPALDSANVLANHFAYGDWSQLKIGQWGAIDFTVDAATLAHAAQTRLIVNFWCDAKLLLDGALKFGAVSAE